MNSSKKMFNFSSFYTTVKQKVTDMKRSYDAIKRPWIESTVVVIVVWIAFMAFKTTIINWADSLVFPLFEIEQSGWSDVLLCIAALICGYYSLFKTPKIISTGWLSAIFCVWLFFVLSLKFDSEWTYICLFDCHWLPYIGVLLFFLTIPWLIKYIVFIFNSYRKRNSKKEEGGSKPKEYRLLKDSALENESDDEFGWSSHVEALIRDILFISGEGSVSVAITGAWGTGKTSYLNLFKSELKKENGKYIIMEFNPRRSASASTIQNDFLIQLRGKLSEYDSSIGNSISKYVEVLKLIDDRSLFPKLISLTGLDSPEHYKNSIEDVIASTGKTLIVLIDDLDRLTGSEIMEVLKLVNLNVNFRNSVFISAFDKDYIEKTLASIVINRQSDAADASGIRNYTDKYFTFERPLPSVKPIKMIKFLYDLIKKKSDSEEDIDSNQALMSFLSYNMKLICEYLPTIRDIKRFINLLIPSYLEKKDDVEFPDFFLITLLRYRYPATYDKIRLREIVDIDRIDSSQVFRLDSSESIEGKEIISQLFDKRVPGSEHYLDIKYFKSIRHKKAFHFYFYGYDDSSICFKDYLKIANPETDIREAKQKLNELAVKGSDTYSIIDLVYDDAIRMSFRNKNSYKRSIELRVSLADRLNDFTIGNLMYMVKVMPESEFISRLGFGEGDQAKNAYREWLQELISGFGTSNGVRVLLQNMMYSINGPEEEVFTRSSVIDMIRHHLNKLTIAPEPENIDINLFLELLLASTTRIDENTKSMDSACLDTASGFLINHPELFYPRFFQGFPSKDKTSYKIVINPNGMASILSHRNTFSNLRSSLGDKSDNMPKAIVYFFDNYFSRGIYEWNIDYPEGFNPTAYKYNYDLMTDLFAKFFQR